MKIDGMAPPSQQQLAPLRGKHTSEGASQPTALCINHIVKDSLRLRPASLAGSSLEYLREGFTSIYSDVQLPRFSINGSELRFIGYAIRCRGRVIWS